MEPEQTREEALAEIPFLVMATVLARDTNLTDDEIAAAQEGLNTLDIPELMRAMRSAPYSPTELFELAWLQEDAEDTLSQLAPLLPELFGDRRGHELRLELLELARLIAGASDRPLDGAVRVPGEARDIMVHRVGRALGLPAAEVPRYL